MADQRPVACSHAWMGEEFAKAIKAVARKLAVIFYNMVLKKEPFDIKKVQQDTAVQDAKKVARLQKELAKYGYTVKKTA